jgi:hypothetical protein
MTPALRSSIALASLTWRRICLVSEALFIEIVVVLFDYFDCDLDQLAG